MEGQSLKYSIVIPAYNEESVIANTLTAVQEFINSEKIPAEIIVVDDGSSDKTREIVAKYNVRLVPHPQNMGKGQAVKTGYFAAKAPVVIVMDADNSLPISNLQKAEPLLRDNHIIVASRYLDKKNTNYPFFRKVMSRTFSFVVWLLFGLNLTDTQCGFKIYKKPFCDEIFKNAKIKGWAYDVEILYNAHKKGLKIAEFPVTFIPAERDSKIKNHFATSLSMLIELFKIRFPFLR